MCSSAHGAPGLAISTRIDIPLIPRIGVVLHGNPARQVLVVSALLII